MDAIILRGVKTHNLKNFDLILPHRKFYVITGVSGSGKSSLAFDTLYAEGQRRYVESLSAYARQFLERMEKPDVEAISGIPPAIAIEAKNVITNARSTVGTQTEINDYLRVFFSRIGKTICPDCQEEARASDPERVKTLLMERFGGREAILFFRIPLAGKTKNYLKEFLPELARQGFTEFFRKGKIVPLEAVKRESLLKEDLAVVVDRLSLHSQVEQRLLESLELAFKLGKGKMEAVIGGHALRFFYDIHCFRCGKIFKEPTPNLFSFNSPLGACAVCQGFGRVITVDWNLVIPDVTKSISRGAVEPWTKPSAEWEFKHLLKFCQKNEIPLEKPWKDLSEKAKGLILFGDRPVGERWKEGDYFSVQDFFRYLEKKTYKMHVRVFLSKYRTFIPCEVCRETRLKQEALWVRVHQKNIFKLQSMSLQGLQNFFEELPLLAAEKEKVEPIYLEIKRRLRFLNEVGLGYLSLARLSRTLSGGEVQRIHLATSLGSSLVDTLYVLDEPSIGLHERDNRLLIRLLHELRDLGNTVVVVEHDRTMIEAADEVIDLGPGGGEAGGKIIFQGPVSQLAQVSGTLTGDYLSGRMKVERPSHETRAKKTRFIEVEGASQHNLKEINVKIPLHQFVVMTGVSGSGKSTFLYDILYHHYQRYRGRPVQELGKVRSIQGFDALDEMILIDQSPIGRTPRSNPATYMKAYDDIRRIFASTPSAKRHGFEPRHFSFNVEGGRCAVCKGDGRIKVEMHFLADVFIPCEACQGKRFKAEVLEVRQAGKNIDEVLAMTVEEALHFFEGEHALLEKLKVLKRVGLGYLRLGQSATTLSGGEAQRLKLASEMSSRNAQHILYLFDEPTTGLHYHDIQHLMNALNELLERGHSLILIEHNMEVIRLADYLIDLGPEGGEQGGNLVYEGPREGIQYIANSFTGKYLQNIEEISKHRS